MTLPHPMLVKHEDIHESIPERGRRRDNAKDDDFSMLPSALLCE
jgi:hypothetical protein